MDRKAMIDAVFAKTDLDMDLIDTLTNEQLKDILELNRAPSETAKPEPVKPARRKTIQTAPHIVSLEYVERDGALFALRTFSDDSQSLLPAADRVQFQGRTVSAAIVLHWVRTGEILPRAPRAKRTRYQAAIRHNGRVIHLGRFNTIEEAQAAKADARFKLSLGIA